MTASLTNNHLIANTFATGNTPNSAAPFATTRPSTTTRATRHSARSYHPGQDTRATVLEAASGLVVDGGFAAATTRHIAELTGLASGAVIRDFGSHDDLLATVFHRLAEDELTAVDRAVRSRTGAVDRLTALVHTVTTRALRGRATAEALLHEPVSARVTQERMNYRRQYHALIVDIVTDGIAAGELPTQNPATSARAVTATVVESLSPSVPVLPALTDEVTGLVLRLVGARH